MAHPDPHQVARADDGRLVHRHAWPSPGWSPATGSRLLALRKAERLVRELAACQDVGDLRLRGRRLVTEARDVVAQLDATDREPIQERNAER